MAGDLPIQMQPAVSMGPAGTRPGAVSGAECHACEPTASAPVDRPRPYIPTRLVLLCLLPRFHAAAPGSLHPLPFLAWPYTAFPRPSGLPFLGLPDCLLTSFHWFSMAFRSLSSAFHCHSLAPHRRSVVASCCIYTAVSLQFHCPGVSVTAQNDEPAGAKSAANRAGAAFPRPSTAYPPPICCLFTAYSPHSTAFSLPFHCL